jgi:DNA polymerase beta
MNIIIIESFEKLIAKVQNDLDNEDNTIQNKFRLKQLSRILYILKKYPTKISLSNYKELLDVDGIGKSTIARIKEILETGKLSEIEDFVDTNKEKKNTIEQLEQVVGIGKKNALDLYNQGILSVKMLKLKIKNNEIKVNNKILLGLKYYNKYEMGIPRSEMDLYYNFFTNFIDRINKKLQLNSNNKYIFEICGSYRRGNDTSNDIDCLISRKDTFSSSKQYNHLERLVEKLKNPIKYNLNNPLLLDSMTDKKIKTKYMGFSKLLNNPIRRIDIRFIPYDSYYSGLLYFTGSGDLNKKMRNIAKEKGYKLSEYGLFTKNGEKIKINSEQDIFKKLDIPYLPPNKR